MKLENHNKLDMIIRSLELALMVRQGGRVVISSEALQQTRDELAEILADEAGNETSGEV